MGFRTFSALMGSLTILTSCTEYRSHFDCSPGRGVPCTSVSKIESMIIETSKGPDIFTGCQEKREAWKDKKANLKICRVWIEEAETEDGHVIGGHYLYFTDDSGC